MPIKPLFEAHSLLSIGALRNPTQPNLVRYVRRPVLDTRLLARGPEGEGATPGVQAAGTELAPAVDDPRTVAPLDRYQLIMLLTGTPRPKAVVIDPTGNRFELEPGDPIGSEGGRLRAVLQYRMLVSVPGQRKLVAVGIEPPLARLAGASTEPDEDDDAPRKKRKL
jgi:hypothetical protein